MKLIDPTDEQLNWAFATDVCKWTPAGREWIGNTIGSFNTSQHNFLGNTEVLLKRLDEMSWESRHVKSTNVNYYVVELSDYRLSWPHIVSSGEHTSFNRAAMIALLRYNGTEIEFSSTLRTSALTGRFRFDADANDNIFKITEASPIEPSKNIAEPVVVVEGGEVPSRILKSFSERIKELLKSSGRKKERMQIQIDICSTLEKIADLEEYYAENFSRAKEPIDGIAYEIVESRRRLEHLKSKLKNYENGN